MSIFYQLSGTVQVKHSQATDEIIRRFNVLGTDELKAEVRSSTTDANGNTVDDVEFEGGVFTSNSEMLDEIAEELGEHVVKPAFLQWSNGEDDGQLYIGPAEDETDAQSDDALEGILDLIQYLTPVGREKLRQILDKL